MTERAAPAPSSYVPGLEGVVATQTAICKVADGELVYRGYHIDELAGRAEYEEVAYLLLHGALPDKDQLRDFKAELVKNRQISPLLRDLIKDMSESGTPMDVLRTVISATALEDPSEGDNSPDAELRKAIRLTAKLPTVLAAYIRRRKGLQPIPPEPSLGHAANFAHMALGETAHPRAAEVLNTCFILQAEHGLNASTFTGRIVASTGADCGAALSAAVGALSGPLHGGAPAYVIPMLDEVAAAGDAEMYVKDLLDRGGRIMGFGHRIYRAEDPRSRILKRTAKELGAARVEVAEELEAVALAALQERHPERVLATNVEYYSAVVLDVAEIPPALAPAMFACSRVAGWSAHILEQKRTGRLFRPSAKYVGPGARSLESV
jgi:citrate synthase